MVQRAVLLQDAGSQAFDTLDAADLVTPTLAAVLAAGKDPATNPAMLSAATATGAGSQLALQSSADNSGKGGNASLSAGSSLDASKAGGAVFMEGGPDTQGGIGANFGAYGASGVGGFGRVEVFSNNDYGVAGKALVSDGNNLAVWGGVPSAAGVPAGAPNGFLPFKYDSTAVTGGMYFWNGSAWVKIANIL